MRVLVYKPDIMFSVSSRSRRPIRSGSTPLLSKVSRLLPTEDCDRMCVCGGCVCIRGCLVAIEYFLLIIRQFIINFHLYVTD